MKGASDVTLIYYKDMDNENIEKITKALNPNVVKGTSAQAVYRVSPIVVPNKKSRLVYPRIKVDETNMTQLDDKLNTKDDEKNVKIKFDDHLQDSALVKTNNTANYLTNEELVDNDIEVKKPDEDTDTRKFLDKFNLIRGFLYAMDPYNNKSHLTGEDGEGQDESDLKFDTLNDRLDQLFDIK